MSFDYQLAWPCPHLTVEEVVTLDTDRTSLLVRQPVAAAGIVRIMVNDEFFIPPAGVLTVGQLFGTDSGPFDLQEGHDTISITTPAGTTTISLGIVGKERWAADRVIQKLKQNGFTIAFVENVNGHLVFTDTSEVGPASYVAISGSAAASLGFGAQGTNNRQRRARGRKVYPSWRLAVRDDVIVNRYPQFTEPVQANPTFKVSYSVPVQRCLRCRGTFVENDMRFSETGQGIMIDNEDLLYQAALKILLTDRSSNPYHAWYGTTIRSRIGTKAMSGVATLISEDIRRALSRLQTVQREQSQYQQVTLKETMYAILQVQVQPHEQDPTTFLVDVTVQNASSDPVSLSIVFTVPEVVALMGSNGLFLGTESAGLTSGRAADLFLPEGT